MSDLLETIKQYIHYDPEEGEFTRIKSTSPRAPLGKITTRNTAGSRVTKIEGKVYQLARLAYLWVYGQMPSGRLTFIDGDSDNLRIDNIEVSAIHNPLSLSRKQMENRTKAHAEPEEETVLPPDPWKALLERRAIAKEPEEPLEIEADPEWDAQPLRKPLNPVMTSSGVILHAPIDAEAKLRAVVIVGGKTINLGRFRTPEEVEEAKQNYLRSRK